MKLQVSRRATRRLREIAEYIHDHDPAAARRVQQALRSAFTLLATYPDAGRALTHQVRSFAVPRLPYLIYYRVDRSAGTVTVVTIRHTARRRLIAP